MFCKREVVLLLAFVSLSTVALAVEQHTGRKLQSGGASSRRKLLDINVAGTSSFTLTAFGTEGQTPEGNCYLQGYPGSRADATVAGPLTVNVYPNNSTTVYFSRGQDTYFANYNYSGNIGVATVNTNSSYGLSDVSFRPQSVGQYVNIFSGLISGQNPITVPTCLVNITFVAVPQPSPPPTPASTPGPNGSTCSGPIPCYCQNGYCFNNGATLSTNCNPPAGQSCTQTTVSPSSIGVQYAFGYGSSVSVCKCTPTTGK